MTLHEIKLSDTPLFQEWLRASLHVEWFHRLYRRKRVLGE